MPFKTTPELQASAIALHRIREEQALVVSSFVDELAKKGAPLKANQHVFVNWGFVDVSSGRGPCPTVVDTVLRVGSVAVNRKSDVHRRPFWSVVDVRSGLAFIAWINRRRTAFTFARSMGPRFDSYIERCAKGDARALATIARFTRCYSTRMR